MKSIFFCFLLYASSCMAQLHSNKKDSIEIYKIINAEIDSAFKLDQKDRAQIQIIMPKYGINSKEAQDIFDQTAAHDSSNILIISKIFDKYGWPDLNNIGKDRSIAIWAILQHADSAIQEKYFPIMQLAVEQKKLLPKYFALTVDRRLVRKGMPQIYGSQLQIDQQIGKRSFFPIEDPHNLNNRRKSVGLDSIESYAKGLGVAYINP